MAAFTGMMDGLIVDNFAGGGGASSGIEAAFGRPVDYAINHDPEAVAMHLANHPQTEHICQSVWKADPAEVAKGREVALAWFSPDCKHFSKAKGGRPVEKNIRDLAWVVVHWAQRVRPKVIMLENVEEFRQWCPVDERGMPIRDPAVYEQFDLLNRLPPPLTRKGRRRNVKPTGKTFDIWCAALRKCGYKLEFRELRGCDYGTPTIRKRLFVIARCDGEPIVWPQPSHRPPHERAFERWKRDLVARGFLEPSEDLPCYKTAANDVVDFSIDCPSIFDRDKPLAENTLRRIAAGIWRFVINSPRPFIVPVCNSGWGNGARDGDDPFPTVTTAKGGEFAVVTPTLVHTAHGDKDSKGKRRGRGDIDPHTPTPTTTTTGSAAVVMATMIHRGNGERAGQQPRAMSVEQPTGTAMAGGIKTGIVQAKAQKVAAFMAQHQSDSRGKTREGRPADDPISTLVHRGTQQQIVVAHLEQANTGMVGHEMPKPTSTIVGKGCTQRLVTSNLVKLRGTSAAHLDSSASSTEESIDTISAGGTHIAEVRAQLVASFLLKYYSGDSSGAGHSIEDPMGSATTRDRLALVTVTIDGEEYVIVDIGMRMLTPRELARAQGFPDSYILDPWVERVMSNGKVKRYQLPKTSQVRMIGNSVNRQVAEALVAANCNKPTAMEEEARAA